MSPKTPILCHICGAPFYDIGLLYEHIKTFHPEPPTIPSEPCIAAFLFGATILAKAFPILRAFRDAVLPNVITNLYYHSGHVILHGLKLI